MRIEKVLSRKNVKIIGYVILTFFSTLLIREIFQYYSLPSSDDVPETISLFKYQENTVIQGYLWCLMIFLGIGLIKQKIFGWLIPQTIILIGFAFFLFVFSVEISDISKELIIIWIFYSLFCFVIFRFFIKGKPKAFFNISKNKMPYYYGIATILAAIYWILEFTIW